MHEMQTSQLVSSCIQNLFDCETFVCSVDQPASSPAKPPVESKSSPAAPAQSSLSPDPAPPKSNGHAGSPAPAASGGAMPSGSMKHGVLTAQTVRGAADFKPSDEDPSGSKGTELKFKPGEVSSGTAGVRCHLLQVVQCLELGPCYDTAAFYIVCV